MSKEKQSWNKSRIEALQNAFKGFIYAFKNEINLKIEVVISIIAIILAVILKITPLEFVIVIFSIGLVILAELLNTALEIITDISSLNYNNKIRRVKDISAAIVVITAVMAAVAGYVIYLDKFIVYINKIFNIQ